MGSPDGLPDELNVDTYRHYLPKASDLVVTLDGVEIQNRCVAANRADGWVDLIPDVDDPAWVGVRDSVPITRQQGLVAFLIVPERK